MKFKQFGDLILVYLLRESKYFLGADWILTGWHFNIPILFVTLFSKKAGSWLMKHPFVAIGNHPCWFAHLNKGRKKIKEHVPLPWIDPTRSHLDAFMWLITQMKKDHQRDLDFNLANIAFSWNITHNIPWSHIINFSPLAPTRLQHTLSLHPSGSAH